MSETPYRADEHDVLFRSFPDTEHVIAHCDDEMWAVHIADALNLKTRYGRGELSYSTRGD